MAQRRKRTLLPGRRRLPYRCRVGNKKQSNASGSASAIVSDPEAHERLRCLSRRQAIPEYNPDERYSSSTQFGPQLDSRFEEITEIWRNQAAISKSARTLDVENHIRAHHAAKRDPIWRTQAHSYLSASIGCIREAFRAGKNPDTIPTIPRIVAEMIITLIEACRKIAPSWSVVL